MVHGCLWRHAWAISQRKGSKCPRKGGGLRVRRLLLLVLY